MSERMSTTQQENVLRELLGLHERDRLYFAERLQHEELDCELVKWLRRQLDIIDKLIRNCKRMLNHLEDSDENTTSDVQ